MADNYQEFPHPPDPTPEPDYETASGQMGLAQQKYPGPLVREHAPTITELLVAKKNHLEYQLEQVNKALEEARANEGAMRLMDAIAKTRVHG